MATVYICSQPLSGATRSKAVFRVLGTLIGAAAAVVLVPNLVNAPVLLVGALALWVALCLYVSLLDRTPRSYVFMLAGYTAALIGFPAVTDPHRSSILALARGEEITLGIVCASLVSSLVLPRSVGAVVAARVNPGSATARASRSTPFQRGGDDRRRARPDPPRRRRRPRSTCWPPIWPTTRRALQRVAAPRAGAAAAHADAAAGTVLDRRPHGGPAQRPGRRCRRRSGACSTALRGWIRPRPPSLDDADRQREADEAERCAPPSRRQRRRSTRGSDWLDS